MEFQKKSLKKLAGPTSTYELMCHLSSVMLPAAAGMAAALIFALILLEGQFCLLQQPAAEMAEHSSIHYYCCTTYPNYTMY